MEEVDFDRFMEILHNNELQVVSRKWTKEEKEELSELIAKGRIIQEEINAKKKAEIINLQNS